MNYSIRFVSMSQVVGIIGASDKPDRYAYLAAESLEKHGHQVLLVNPFKESIHGKLCLKHIGESTVPVDTVTIYVNAERFKNHLDSIIESKPKRIIFNPGAESQESYETLEKNGIEVVEACTLVMLNTGQF